MTLAAATTLVGVCPPGAQVEAYRIWIISNNARLIDLDGEKVTAAEKRARIKDPPAVVKDAKSSEELDEYLGKKVTVKLFEQTAQLLQCFDSPETTLEVVARVQENILKLVPIDPRGRVMFDFEQEDTRDELELMEDDEKEEDKKSEHGTDLRAPEDIIEECALLLPRCSFRASHATRTPRHCHTALRAHVL